MPVTARLSKAFYDRLGEEIANELVEWFNQVDATYRSDLREINELNFARFDAKLEQRFAEQDARIEQRFAEQDRRFGEMTTRMEQRFTDMSRANYAAWAVQMAATITILLRLFLS